MCRNMLKIGSDSDLIPNPGYGAIRLVTPAHHVGGCSALGGGVCTNEGSSNCVQET